MGDQILNLKIALGGVGSAFVLGAIFWAGAAYNRLSSIEVHMNSIDNKITDYSALVERVATSQQEIKSLREDVRQLQLRMLSTGH